MINTSASLSHSFFLPSEAQKARRENPFNALFEGVVAAKQKQRAFSIGSCMLKWGGYLPLNESAQSSLSVAAGYNKNVKESLILPILIFKIRKTYRSAVSLFGAQDESKRTKHAQALIVNGLKTTGKACKLIVWLNKLTLIEMQAVGEISIVACLATFAAYCIRLCLLMKKYFAFSDMPGASVEEITRTEHKKSHLLMKIARCAIKTTLLFFAALALLLQVLISPFITLLFSTGLLVVKISSDFFKKIENRQI